MKNNMRKVFLIFFIISFFAMGVTFICSASMSKDLVLLIPGGIALIGAIFSVVLLCKKQSEYRVINEELVVTYNGKDVSRLKKDDICSLKFVYDAFDESLYMIRFSVQNKRHNIVINPENRSDMLLFFENHTKTISRNLIYYLVMFLTGLQ
ncbi:MAG: hypothetical protein E7384_04055 [Ruminococcaceae bacterium]|nr:hypothetical protein [Oscillospiraceae bacterium]